MKAPVTAQRQRAKPIFLTATAMLVAGVVLMLSQILPALAATLTEVDRDSSQITFVSRQMGVPVQGHFDRWEVEIQLDEADLDNSHAQVIIDTASISTGNEDADTEVKRRSWLDVAGFPEARFQSGRVRSLGDRRYEADGELSIKDKTQPLTVPFRVTDGANGRELTGEFVIKRADFGIGGGMWAGFDVVANEVTVRFKLHLVDAD
jgi:polyisoprenoid-binding protein YceI